MVGRYAAAATRSDVSLACLPSSAAVCCQLMAVIRGASASSSGRHGRAPHIKVGVTGSPHRLRITTRVLAVFLGGTILATVYLGWHFAVDDGARVGTLVAQATSVHHHQVKQIERATPSGHVARTSRMPQPSPMRSVAAWPAT